MLFWGEYNLPKLTACGIIEYMVEMLIVFGGVGIPLIVIGLYALYRTNKEERKEQMQAKNA